MITQLVYFVLYLVIVGAILGLLIYLVDQFVPQPFHRIARMVIIVLGVIILILMLLSLIGEGPGLGRLRFG
jgi:hypothetical protein